MPAVGVLPAAVSLWGQVMNRTQRVLWTLFGAAMAVLVGIALWRQRQPAPLPVLGEWSSFRLTNQWGAAVSPESLRGAVTVVDVI
ncbi:MAG: hypothetical protein J0L84_11695, partial [Verrucomicrobia bacterium]|nr:hypothetical protein [Verrucomicrobiota bacterium]